MSYKPNFCCQCGDKIDRTDWKITTSRRFCELCETDFKMQDWFPHGVLVFGLVMMILGFGTYWQKSREFYNNKSFAQLSAAKQPASSNSADKIVEPQMSANQNVRNLERTQPNPSNIATILPNVPNTAGETLKTKQSVVTAVTQEAVYFCGAQTKKGSPCSRKVKGGGRCWQHSGQAAMMAQEKLIISR